jgi:hypothetical protein
LPAFLSGVRLMLSSYVEWIFSGRCSVIFAK